MGRGSLTSTYRQFAGAAMTEQSLPAHVPASATPEGDGVVIGDGPARVDAYIDFLCPYCRQFELTAGPTLAGLAGQHLATVAYHPMNFLDAASTTAYSTRAAAAAGCAADFGRFAEYAHELFTHQPPEGGPGLGDDELAALGEAAGLAGTGFTGCLAQGAYRDWPSYVTARAAAAGVSSTPAVLVAGEPTPADPDAITAAVTAAGPFPPGERHR
jgi:protein-disulfide isomerase